MKTTHCLFTILMMLCALCTNAKTPLAASSSNSACFSKGTTVAQALIGFGGNYGVPITLVAEHGITDKIGIGGTIGYGRLSTPFGIWGDYTINHILIGGRGHYHAYTTDKIDVYGAATLGYSVASISYPSTAPSSAQTASAGGFIWAGNIGGRYYFNPKFAAVAEIGYGLANVNIGLAMKL
jgi:hypothetical protein